ncbi:putative Dol-P-Glc:Glc(2)Man(9)GlcNAc(2)-PP-Dol alpha-1,2-glucosyltransferase [Chrysoperla carnea]|uniref:putative Dol-P-Glc:Glc(2)Man(9)GlcNAc(2)-PP-Dol alpha-1,2-glucosyltransferase n=1 Tax=Chrysoperla carnea TaxID=189513 RepID=UPI001D08B5FE|nr:putative Dol-P-Glc:Glc(2)Man(9)GlcNAc(2)-PP-Dol alpha-1,2-glucosyltransferase [Chrysoperla carnea]
MGELGPYDPASKPLEIQQNNKKIYLFLFLILITVYLVISKIILDNVYATSKIIIDELFHIPQGLAYCAGNFSEWDSKITTLPGLYMVSTVLLGPFQLCTDYNLRFINYLAGVLNIILFAKIAQNNNNLNGNIIWTAFNVALLPPLYFFSFVYYTDILSITSVLLMFYFCQNDKHVLASILGGFSILMRQTNVLWVGMCLANLVIDIFVSKFGPNYGRKKSKIGNKNAIYNIQDLQRAVINFTKRKFPIRDLINIQNVYNILSYLLILIGFIVFVVLNGGIVVGDKQAHTAVLHLPQIYYFSLFYLIFGCTSAITKIIDYFQFCLRNKFITIFLLVIGLCIIHWNTLVHPYLLADNRHYTFYVWNRFYGKYKLFKYIMIIVYNFSLYSFFMDIHKNNNFGFVLVFLPCMIIPIILQKMLEIRYFLLPFIIVRLKLRNISNIQLICESILYIVINILSFYVFFTKEIRWSNFEDIQRLIW